MNTHKKYYLMAFVLSTVAVLALIVGTNYAISAPENVHRSTPVYLALDDGKRDGENNAADSHPLSPDVPVMLELDDGSYEGAIGQPGGLYEFLFLNRFSPSPSLFPFDLSEVRVYFPNATSVFVGDNISIVVYQDTDSNPANGATFLASYPATIQSTDAWSIYNINPPLNITGPQDVLIGVIALKKPDTIYFPAALDETSSQQRSWYGEWLVSPPPNPPVLPPDYLFELVDNLGPGFPGNWMIRGYGEHGSSASDTPTLTTSPDGTQSTPTGTPEPGDQSFLPLTINKHPTATATLPPTPTSEAPTPTSKPSPTNTPDSGGPEQGTYTGDDPDVSFDVTAGNQVCDFEIKAPFSTGYCILTPPCMDIVNNSFEFSVAEVGAIYSINGNFDTQTHAVGDYSVRMCKGTLQYPPSEGTWEASK